MKIILSIMFNDTLDFLVFVPPAFFHYSQGDICGTVPPYPNSSVTWVRLRHLLAQGHPAAWINLTSHLYFKGFFPEEMQNNVKSVFLCKKYRKV